MTRLASKKLQSAYRHGRGKHLIFLNFCILALLLVGSLPSVVESQTAQRPTSAKRPKVIIGISGTDQVEDIALGYAELADVQVYLESLGDLVDKYLVMLISNADNKRIRSKLSDEHGRVRFVGIAPGDYRVEVSRKLREDGELSTVKIGDLVLTRSQKRDISSQLSDDENAAPGSTGNSLNLNRK